MSEGYNPTPEDLSNQQIRTEERGIGRMTLEEAQEEANKLRVLTEKEGEEVTSSSYTRALESLNKIEESYKNSVLTEEEYEIIKTILKPIGYLIIAGANAFSVAGRLLSGPYDYYEEKGREAISMPSYKEYGNSIGRLQSIRKVVRELEEGAKKYEGLTA